MKILLSLLMVAASLGMSPPVVSHEPVSDIPGLQAHRLALDEVTLHYRLGGEGPPVLLIHGYTQTGRAWRPLVAPLLATHTVVVPDLRGIGMSSLAAEGDYHKASAAADLKSLIDHLGYDQMDVVGHDIGLMVAYALAAQWPERVRRLVVMDAPLPGIAPWQQVIASPKLWHFHFHGPTAEALVAGREEIYFTKFWEGFSAHPQAVLASDRAAYLDAYQGPGRMAAGFAYFASMSADAEQNQIFAENTLPMPILAMGGEYSAGGLVESQFSQVASDVTGTIITGSGHWLLEEQTPQVIAAITDFLRR